MDTCRGSHPLVRIKRTVMLLYVALSSLGSRTVVSAFVRTTKVGGVLPFHRGRQADYSSAATNMVAHEVQELVKEAVLALPQMQDKTMLHLTVVGSRSRGLANTDSDYDVKVIVLHSMTNYLLQKTTSSKSFVTSIKTEESPTGDDDDSAMKTLKVEGTLVDYLTMQKYALSSNFATYETLIGGITVYKTEASAYLEHLFRKTYSPQVLITSLQGIGTGELKKADKKKATFCVDPSGYVKHAANMVYYASVVHAIAACPVQDPPPTLNAYAILQQQQNDLEPKLEEAIHSLYAQRRKLVASSTVSSTDVDDILEPFTTYLESASEVKAPQQEELPRQELLNALHEEANEQFLQLVMSSRGVEQERTARKSSNIQ